MGGKDDQESFDLRENLISPSRLENRTGLGFPENKASLRIYIVLVTSVAVGILLSLIAIGLTVQRNEELPNEVSQIELRLETSLGADRRKTNKSFQSMRKDLLELDGWLSATGETYYKLFNRSLSFNRSKAECEKLGANLLAKAIRNAEEIQYMKEKGILKTVGRDIWIGYTDAEEEGVWKWVDGGRTNSSTVKWLPGQPDDWKTGEHCAEIRGMNGTVILLNDANCDTDQYKFICEKTV